MHTIVWVILLMCLSVSVAGVVVVFRRFWRTPSRLRAALINSLSTAFALGYLCLALEAYFAFFGIASDSFGCTLAAKRWFQLYGRPVNSLGYRDDEHPPDSLNGKRVLFCVGDSFTWGSGIKDYRDVYPKVLAARLGSSWEVVNIAIGGWDTSDEINGLKHYPAKPGVIVWEYFLNDIDSAAQQYGVQVTPNLPMPPGILGGLVQNSYLADRVYWSTVRIGLKQAHESYWDRFKQCYARDEIWKCHVRQLHEFVNYVQEQRVGLVALIIPNLFAIEDSMPIAGKVEAAMREMGVDVLNLAPLLVGRAPADMVCNPFNGHANEGPIGQPCAARRIPPQDPLLYTPHKFPQPLAPPYRPVPFRNPQSTIHNPRPLRADRRFRGPGNGGNPRRACRSCESRVHA
jgi:hypothetical protein